MKKVKRTSRLFEQLLGIFGSFISIISSSFIIFLESGGQQGNSFIAIISIIGAILGFVSSFYVNKDIEYAGVGFVIAAILILMGIPRLGVLGAIVLLIAGMSALFRK